jgi:hypothetical protein
MKKIYYIEDISSQQPLYIHHHMGLGDHIFSYGIVNFLTQQYSMPIYLFCWKNNLKNLTELYKSKNINLIPLNRNYNEYSQVYDFLNDNDQLLVIGHEKLSNYSCGSYIDQIFYKQLDLPYSFMFKYFDYERDLVKETTLFDSLNIHEYDYYFIHEYNERNFNQNIIENRLQRKLNKKIITSQDLLNLYTGEQHQFNFFNIGKILEKADSLFMVNSSIKCYTSYLNISQRKTNLYLDKENSFGQTEVFEWILF